MTSGVEIRDKNKRYILGKQELQEELKIQCSIVYIFPEFPAFLSELNPSYPPRPNVPFGTGGGAFQSGECSS